MIIQFHQGPGKNIPAGRIQFDQLLDLLHVTQFGFSNHLIPLVIVIVTGDSVCGKNFTITITIHYHNFLAFSIISFAWACVFSVTFTPPSILAISSTMASFSNRSTTVTVRLPLTSFLTLW